MAEWTTDQIIARIRGEAQHQGVDPDLAVAVATQESYLNANATGDNGKSLGLFQLQPAAALDVGVNPAWRHEPGVNIYGGVSYLKQKLQQSKGNVEDALRRYNGGGDPNYVQNVMRFFKPGVAEASERPQAGTYTDTDVHNALQALQSSQEPTGGTYTDEDVQNALKALEGTQPSAGAPTTPAPVSPTAPTPAPAGVAPGGLPAPSPADEQSAAQTVQAMRQRQAPREPVTDPAALLAGGGGPAPPTREQQILAEARARQQRGETPAGPGPPGGVVLPRPPADAPLEEQNPAQTWMDTALDVGYGAAGAVVGGATAGLPGMLAGPVLAQGALERARMQLGMRPQEKAVFELGPVNVYQSDLLNAGFSLLLGTPDIVKSVLSRSKAGQAIRAADDATRVAHQAWQTAAQDARAAQQAGRQEAYQAAERKALDAQARYQAKVQARDQTIQANEQTYRQALQEYAQEVTAARTQGYRQTEQALAQQQRAYQGQVTQQAADVAAQSRALQTARAVPGRSTPETPSWVLYEKFGDAAKDAVVDLAPAKTALAEVRASRGVLPTGEVRPFPQAVESLAATLEKASGTANVQTIREEMRRLGPLTRSADGNVRGAAKQLYGIYAEALEASPVANDLLRSANATFRKEMALQDVQEWLRPGHGVVRMDQQGRETINVGALLTRLEKQVGDDAQFARSFGPDDLQAIRQDFGRLAGTPKMPTSPPRAPRPELLPGSAPDVPARLREAPTPPGTPAEVQRPRLEALPGGAGPGRRMPDAPLEPAPVTPRQALGERPAFAGPRTGTWGAILASMTALGVPAPITAVTAALGAAHVTQRQGRWLIAHALLDPRRRGLMQAAMDSQGRLDRRVYGVMQATLSPAEKRQYLRETR